MTENSQDNLFPPSLRNLKVALVHDWLDSYRGGEKVLEALMELFPEAPIYTLFCDPNALPPHIRDRKIIAPRWLAPFRRVRKALLPIFPMVIESFPTEKYDLILSSSSCVAKGVVSHPNAKHISYIHSPMRYIWDQRHHYIGGKPAIVRFFFHILSTRLRSWDQTSSMRIDQILVNSQFVAKRVEKFYRREATVIPPPVDVQSFITSTPPKSGGYLLVAGAFVPYKRFDLAIKACEQAGKTLIVAGSGPEEGNLRQLSGKFTKFIIKPDQKAWIDLFQKADGFLFPASEDFGITAIEALASGTPLIAYEEGGALDFVEPGVTGCFFKDQTPESLRKAIENFDPRDYDRSRLLGCANKYSKDHFQKAMVEVLSQTIP